MDPSYLLSNEAFARRIAIGLLRDRDAAEDLVQEAWERTLEHPARPVASPRGYLASLLRRLAFRRRRTDERRAARERALPAREAEQDSAALVARAEIHRRTVAAVLGLEEPYRTIVLRRFFDDLSIEEIAKRERVPPETARTRLKRALAMLRARLEREGQDWRREWSVALASSGSWPESHATTPERAPLLGWALAAAVATTVVILWRDRARESPSLAANAPGVESNERGQERSAELAPPPSAARTAAETGATETLSEPLLHGRVSDAAGRALAGVHVQLGLARFETSRLFAYAVTGADGRFACSLASWLELSPPARALFGIDVEAWASGHEPLWQAVQFEADGSPLEPELVLQPGRLLTLRVLDERGGPAEQVDAKVRARTSDPARAERWFSSESDRDGWVALGLEPDEHLTEVMLSSPELGFAYRGEAGLPGTTSGDVELGAFSLQPGLALGGRCVHADRTPARRLVFRTRLVEPAPEGGYRPAQRPRDEYVRGLTQVTARTDDQGRFEVRGLRPGSYQLESARLKLGDGRAWSAGEVGLEIVVPIHHLRVEVIGPDGRAIAEAPFALTRLLADGAPAGEAQHGLTMSEPPVASCQVEPGQTVAVLVRVPGLGIVEERVTIPAAPCETPLRIALVPEDRRASLVLRPAAGSASAWRVTLCAPHSLAPLPGFADLEPDDEGRVRGLPCGAFRVRVEPVAAEAGALPEECSAGGSALVALSNGDVVLEFPVLPAGRVRVAFAGEAGAAPALAWSHGAQAEGSAGGTDSRAWMTAQLLRGDCRIELWSDATGAPLLVRALNGKTPGAGQFLDLIAPAGPGRLRLARQGRPLVEHAFDVPPGESVELTIPLDENPSSR